MKKKKSNSLNRLTSIFPLSHAARNALWISLDLLELLRPAYQIGIYYEDVDNLCRRLLAFSKFGETVRLELSPREAVSSSISLDLALELLSGSRTKFDLNSPEATRILKDLEDYAPVIKAMAPVFRQCYNDLHQSGKSV